MEYEIKATSKFSLGIGELIQYRELFYFFTWRDIKVKYKQATLGFFWAILQPFAMMLIFTLVFSKGLGVKSEGIPYPIFAYSGLLIWNVFSNGLSQSANSMITNANIIKKIYFPRLIIPISSILTVLFDFMIALVMFVALIIYYRYNVSVIKILYCLPLSMLLTVITTFGIGSFLAALNVKYRDFQYVVPFLIQFLLFVNPVLYSSKIFDNPSLNFIMRINPIAAAINLNRSTFTGQTVDWQSVIMSFTAAFIFFAIGIYTFRKSENYFADIA